MSYGRVCAKAHQTASRCPHTFPTRQWFSQACFYSFVNIIPNLRSSAALCRSYSSGPSSYDVSSYSIKRSLEEAAKKYL